MAEGGYAFVLEQLRRLGFEDRDGFRCPAHGDEHGGSLGVTDDGRGNCKLRCFARNCSSESIMRAIGCETWQLFIDGRPKGSGKKSRRELPEGMQWRKSKRWISHDEKGHRIHFEDRKEPHRYVSVNGEGRWANCRAEAEALTGNKGLKLTKQGAYTINGDVRWSFDAGWYEPGGGRSWSRCEPKGRHDADRRPSATAVWLPRVEKYLYRLPKVRKAIAAGRRVWLCEGYKDADAMVAAKEEATTGPGGSKTWEARLTKMLLPVEGVHYELWLVLDDDPAGRERATDVGLRLEANGIHVRVCLPAEGCKDPAEHFAAGHGLSDFRELEDWRTGVLPDAASSASAAASSSPSPAPLSVVDVDVRTGLAADRPVSPAPPSAPFATTLHAVAGGGFGTGGGSGGAGWFPVGGGGEQRRFLNTEAGNGERLVHWFGDDLRWCPQFEKWLHWDGRRWEPDSSGGTRVVELMMRVVRGMALEANDARFRGDREALLKWMVRSEGERAVAHSVNMAKAVPGVTVTAQELDRNRDVVVCRNGTLELRTGQMRASERADLCTRSLPIDYDPDARTEHWGPFLDTVTGGDAELQRFLWRSVGYSLTGHVNEHCLFFLYGFGRNGKSTFVEALSRVIGEYGMTADSATLMVRDVKSQIRSDVARLKEARLVAMEETQRGARVDEGVVKWLTGGTRVVARPLYAEEIQFDPQWKFWICGNHKPDVRGIDDGIWRRIRLIPFTQQIPIEKVDKRLGDKLWSEAAGILAWAVEGARQWYESGLADPEIITDAVREYRDEMDVIGQFLRTETEVDRGSFVTGLEMYERYGEWAKRTGSFKLSMKVLGQELKQRGLANKKTNAGVRYLDLRLVDRSLAGSGVTDE